MSPIVSELVRELRELADRIEQIEAAEPDAYTFLGAGMLDLCAFCARQSGFDAGMFLGLARSAWERCVRPVVAPVATCHACPKQAVTTEGLCLQCAVRRASS